MEELKTFPNMTKAYSEIVGYLETRWTEYIYGSFYWQ